MQQALQADADVPEAPCGPANTPASCLEPAATALQIRQREDEQIPVLPREEPSEPGPLSVPTPRLVGLSQDAAIDALQSAGLVLGTVTQQASSTVPAGTVISQNPTAGAAVALGARVNLVVSAGPAPVTVPNVVGQSQSAATAALQNVGLTVGTVTQQASSTVPAGAVISQNPAAGASVAAGTAVNLAVSSGPAPVTVPNVVGLSQNAATTALQNAGLTVGTVTAQASPTVLAGTVISQNPAAGASVAAGTAVNLAVSTGPAPVTVPNVVGLSQNAAASAITGAGLTLGAVINQNSATVPAGNVINQNPAAGASVAPGTAVNLLVSTGPSLYLLTLTTTGSGSGFVSGGGQYPAGATVTLLADPNSTSTFAGWSPSPCAAKFIMPAQNLTCTATFNPRTLTVTTAIASGAGVISPSTRTVNYGDRTSFAIDPASSCVIQSVTGCGGGLSGFTYTTGPITANCTVTVNFSCLR